MKFPEIKLPESLRQFLSKQPNELDLLARWYYRLFCRLAGKEGQMLGELALGAAALTFVVVFPLALIATVAIFLAAIWLVASFLLLIVS